MLASARVNFETESLEINVLLVGSSNVAKLLS